MSFSIKLAWNNTNPGVITRIYRSEQTIDKENPGAPYVTLTNGEQAYEDTNVVYGKNYYYMFESIKGPASAKSRVYMFSALPYSGPGPQALKYGDLEYGYYGTVPAIEFLSADKLVTEFAINATPNTAALTWHKFAHKGKIIYVPNVRICWSLVWIQLYNAGVVFGSDDNGYQGGTVLQDARINVGNDSFKVRLPNSFNPELCVNGELTIDSYPTTGIGDVYKNSDFDLFFAPMMNAAYNNWELPRVENFNRSDIGNGQSRTVMCRELSKGRAQAFAREGSSKALASTVQRIPLNSGASGYSWYPVLELIR